MRKEQAVYLSGKKEITMKTNQNVINTLAMRDFERALKEYNNASDYTVKRLRYCTAEVITTKNYYLLRSYNTIVASINRHIGTECDMLRKVYGYTATSAQHISKFFNDYAVSLSYPAKRYIYR